MVKYKMTPSLNNKLKYTGGMTDIVHCSGWLGRAVLGSFQCRDVLLLWHMVGQGPAVLAAGAGWVGCFFFFFLSRLSYLPYLMPHLLGDGWTN